MWKEKGQKVKKPSLRSIYSLVILFTIIIAPFVSLVPTVKAVTTIYLDPVSTTGLLPGDTFAINVMISEVADMVSWQFSIAFSGLREEVLEVTEVIEGDFLLMGGATYFTSNIDNTAGEVAAGANLLGEVPGVYGDGWLATVVFRVFGGGESPLNLFDTILLNSESLTISHVTTNASYVGAAPYAHFGFRPYQSIDGYLPAVNQTITFNATASYDPTGGTIVSYKWDFDINDQANTPVVTVDPIITHAYVGDSSAAIQYGVGLNITSSTGYIDSYAFTDLNVIVRDISVRITSVSPSGQVKAGTPVSIDVNATNVGTGTESFNVTTLINDVAINTTRVISLNPIPVPYQPPFYHVKNYTVIWDTTGLPSGEYTIGVNVTAYPGDNNMTNNEYVWGSVNISAVSKLEYTVEVYSKSFKVIVETDSDVTGFAFNYALKQIGFSVSGESGISSYVNITIPMTMLNVSDPASWIVELNATSEDFIVTSNGTHYFVYFDYVFASAYEVFITGEVVPIPPQPAFTFSPSLGIVGQPVTFDASSTTDPDGHGIKEYLWRIYTYLGQGDKNITWSRVTTEPTMSVIFNQSYIGAGAQFVSVIATNNFGMANESSERVLEVMWSYDIAVVDIDVSASSVNIGQTMFINVTVRNLLATADALVWYKVTIYGNDTELTTFLVNPPISPPEISVSAAGETKRADYKWNMTTVPGRYTIKATASVVKYANLRPPPIAEVNLADNTFTYGEVTITKWSSTVGMIVSPQSVNFGQGTIVSGSISPLRASVDVTLQYRLGTAGAWSNASKVQTSAQGSYLFNWTPPTAGTYEVRAIWNGDSITFGNMSAVTTLTVRRVASELTLDVSSTSANAGSTVTVSGTVTPAVAGVTVTIRVNRDNAGWTTAGTATTDADGNYEYEWTPSEAGTYQIRASWDGNTNYLDSESVTKSVTIASTGLGDVYIYIAAGAIILVAVVAVVLFLRRRK
jgi:hypothetical protein